VQPPPRASAIWRTALVVLVVFTVLGLLFSSQVWVDYGYSGHRLSWTSALTLALGQWYLWALLTPAIVWLARTFPIERRRLGRSFAVHVSAGLVCAVSVLVAQAALARVVTGIERGPFTLLQAHVNVLTYWAVVGVTHAVQYYVAAHDRALRAAQLESQVTAAQLHALRLQLQPHFLFNTLNAIGALMRENVESADLMLTRLSDLLRATLATSDVAELPLHRELALLAPYLDIQRARIGSRLTLTLEIEPQATDVLVPTLMLQPLVENAIKHGIADRSGPGTIAIAAKLVGAVLEITVCDDGPGPATKWTAGGHGLDNVRRRLAALHGDAASFSLDRLESGGAIARVRLPSRRASS
jgi:two-component system LytT family sensor kinase